MFGSHFGNDLVFLILNEFMNEYFNTEFYCFFSHQYWENTLFYQEKSCDNILAIFYRKKNLIWQPSWKHS